MKKQASQVEALGRGLVELGHELKDLVVLDPDVADSTKTAYFAERFPKRFIRVGISEQDMIGIAAGLAYSGKTPVACGFAMFVAGRSWEQIANSIARPGLNVKIVGTHSGLSPHADGESHQSLCDVALMRVLPNMEVVVPADAVETAESLRTLVKNRRPGYLRLGRGFTPVVYDEGLKFSLGKANVVKDGSDAAVIANGAMVSVAIEASQRLSRSGVNVRVIDMHTVKPLDEVSIEKAARETGAVVTVEEHSTLGGLGGAVAEALSEKRPTPMRRIGVKDKFGTSSRNYPQLLRRYGLTPEAIVDSVVELMEVR
ncbi:MAG: transketolase family protein [Candidatus Bathyarchaeota archaeon]